MFWRVVMPLSVPSFVIVLLFEFQASWNNLQQALIYLNAGSVDGFTAPLGIAYAMTKYSPTAGGQGDYQYVMVASLLVTVPMLVLFGLVLATMMLPGAVTMIPIYLIWKELGALGTWIPLFGANLFGSAFYIFLQRQFFLGLPRELFEAARIDGASYWTMFWRVVMPLSVPSFVIVLLFEFQASWNNLQQALIYLNAGSVDGFTAPLGIAYAMTKYSPTAGGQGDYQYVMVASLLVTVPMLVLFAFGQRYFIEGVATTGRKG